MRKGKQEHWLWIFVGIEPMMILALLIAAIAAGCGNPTPDVKNRVPTLGAQVEQAQQAASDAKDAADRAQAAQKDIHDAVDKLNGSQRDSGGNLKEDRPQQTGPGFIVDFGNDRIPADQNLVATDDFYLGFTFAERSGFTKHFFPVCPSQSIQVNKSIVLLYHWRGFLGETGVGKRGCYIIDGQQAQ